jgi:NAD dependent epimerase/dehydratase
MSWKDKTVLVTGAGGFIGSHLTERLVSLGARTTALVQYNSRSSQGWLERSAFADQIRFIGGDIRDAECVNRAMQEVEVVFHLAALIAIPYSYQAPASYVDTNIRGTLNVLQTARDLGTKRIVHTSTSEVYGTARQVPINEGHSLQAQSPYSATKIGADKLAESFHLSFGLPVVTVRPFNTFGPRQSARAIIPTVITQALAGRKVCLGNLTPTRDLNYVDNTVDGFIAAGSCKAVIGRVVNLGSGREISIGDLAKLIGKLLNVDLQIETEKQRLRTDGSEVERLVADNLLAKQLMNWTPKVSLEEGLQLTIAWLREHQDQYRPDVYTI